MNRIKNTDRKTIHEKETACNASLKHKFMDWFYENLSFVVFAGCCFILTPFAFIFADMQRGYNATGGEVFIPLIPVLWYILRKELMDKNK